MKGWEYQKIGDFSEIGRGSSPRPIIDQAYFVNGNIPWIKIADATASFKYIYRTKEYVNEYGASFSRKLSPRTLILAASGTLGFPIFLGVEGCIHDGWLYFKSIKANVDKQYLYYCLITFVKSFNSFSYGAAIQNINTDILRNTKIPLPPLPIQRKIAAILSAYDDLIENNSRRVTILEKIAEELYREWFVRLRFPGHDKTKIVKGVPDGWELKKLPEIAEITYGYPFDGSRFNDLGIGKPIIRIRNIPDSSTTDYTDEEAKDKHIVRKGDLLVGMDGEFHINHWFGEEAYLVQRSCRIKSHDPSLHGYLSKAIVAPVKFYESILQGATVGHLGAKHLNSIDILIPNSEFKKYLSVFNNLVEQKVNYSSSINNLKTSRDRLLSRLISGKVDVENMDIEFPASMKEELVHA